LECGSSCGGGGVTTQAAPKILRKLMMRTLCRRNICVQCCYMGIILLRNVEELVSKGSKSAKDWTWRSSSITERCGMCSGCIIRLECCAPDRDSSLSDSGISSSSNSGLLVGPALVLDHGHLAAEATANQLESGVNGENKPLQAAILGALV